MSTELTGTGAIITGASSGFHALNRIRRRGPLYADGRTPTRKSKRTDS